MKIGIVGHEAAKFTKMGKLLACTEIEWILTSRGAEVEAMVSGHCHLGGIDIWAEKLAERWGIPREIYPPATLQWSGGYKERNIQIAEASDIVHVIVVNRLPKDYAGMRFDVCYHCARLKDPPPPHIKSGGCWTGIHARKLGKQAKWTIIEQEDG